MKHSNANGPVDFIFVLALCALLAVILAAAGVCAGDTATLTAGLYIG